MSQRKISAVALSSMYDTATSSQILGPGVWSLLHMVGLDADNSTTDEVTEHFIYLVQLIANNFKANDCRDHFAQFVKANILHQGRAFEWTVRAHNDVNRRNNKPEITVEQARDIWGPDNVKVVPCSSSPVTAAPSAPVLFPLLPSQMHGFMNNTR